MTNFPLRKQSVWDEASKPDNTTKSEPAVINLDESNKSMDVKPPVIPSDEDESFDVPASRGRAEAVTSGNDVKMSDDDVKVFDQYPVISSDDELPDLTFRGGRTKADIGVPPEHNYSPPPEFETSKYCLC